MVFFSEINAYVVLISDTPLSFKIIVYKFVTAFASLVKAGPCFDIRM